MRPPAGPWARGEVSPVRGRRYNTRKKRRGPRLERPAQQVASGPSVSFPRGIVYALIMLNSALTAKSYGSGGIRRARRARLAVRQHDRSSLVARNLTDRTAATLLAAPEMHAGGWTASLGMRPARTIRARAGRAHCSFIRPGAPCTLAPHCAGPGSRVDEARDRSGSTTNSPGLGRACLVGQARAPGTSCRPAPYERRWGGVVPGGSIGMGTAGRCLVL